MKLYFSYGTCALAPHIVLREAGLAFDLERVDLRTHLTHDGVDYYQINPKGSVPLLELDSGERLTEGPVICQYVADKARNVTLMPAAGTMERYRVMEWQNYISSEMHKTYSVLFNAEVDAPVKAVFRAALRKKYEWVESRLAAAAFLTGTNFTAADAYLFTVSRWAKSVEMDLAGLPALHAFMEAVHARPAVRVALDAEKVASAKKH